jgi:hypothetical protein
MPEQVKRPNPWRKMMLMNNICDVDVTSTTKVAGASGLLTGLLQLLSSLW